MAMLALALSLGLASAATITYTNEPFYVNFVQKTQLAPKCMGAADSFHFFTGTLDPSVGGSMSVTIGTNVTNAVDAYTLNFNASSTYPSKFLDVTATLPCQGTPTQVFGQAYANTSDPSSSLLKLTYEGRPPISPPVIGELAHGAPCYDMLDQTSCDNVPASACAWCTSQVHTRGACYASGHTPIPTGWTCV
jgi:hypothetical protein